MEHKKKHSLSRSLQNLFHKKQTYSLKPHKSHKKTKLYESINDGSDVTLNPILSESGKARVWSVRNSYSKSPMDGFSVESASEMKNRNRREKLEKQNVDTATHTFDILNAYQSVVTAEDAEQDIEKCEDFQAMDISNDSSVYSEEMSDRSRLSSFGSSNFCSDTTPSCCSHASSLEAHKTPDDINTSYWDLQLPESLSSRRFQGARRFSDSVSSDPQQGNNSLNPKRRMSDGPMVVSQSSSWQDKVLQSVRDNKVSSTLYLDVPERSELRSQCQENEDGHLPGRGCNRKVDVNVKRSRSVSVRNENKKSIPLQRSRSADSRLRKAMQKTRERNRQISECQFTFSDIESSDESESTAEPKDSSESPVVSSTDASSSYSYNSGNEVNNDKDDSEKAMDLADESFADSVRQLYAICSQLDHAVEVVTDIDAVVDNAKIDERFEQVTSFRQNTDKSSEKYDMISQHESNIIDEEDILEQNRALEDLDKVLNSEKTDHDKTDEREGNDFWLMEFSDDGEVGTDVDTGIKVQGILLHVADMPVDESDQVQNNTGNGKCSEITKGSEEQGLKDCEAEKLVTTLEPISELEEHSTGKCKKVLKETDSITADTVVIDQEDAQSEQITSNANSYIKVELKEYSENEYNKNKLLVPMEPDMDAKNVKTEIRVVEDGVGAQTNPEDVTDTSEKPEYDGQVEFKSGLFGTSTFELANENEDRECSENRQDQETVKQRMNTGENLPESVPDHCVQKASNDNHCCYSVSKIENNKNTGTNNRIVSYASFKWNEVGHDESLSANDNKVQDENITKPMMCNEGVQINADDMDIGGIMETNEVTEMCDEMIQVDFENQENAELTETCDEIVQVDFDTLETLDTNENTNQAEMYDEIIQFVAKNLREDKHENDADSAAEYEHTNQSYCEGRTGLGFQSMSMEDLLFCSGTALEADDEMDDVDKVFEAISKEAEKLENKNKDMMVMFLVGK